MRALDADRVGGARRPGATQRCLNPGCSERIGNSRRTGAWRPTRGRWRGSGCGRRRCRRWHRVRAGPQRPLGTAAGRGSQLPAAVCDLGAGLGSAGLLALTWPASTSTGRVGERPFSRPRHLRLHCASCSRRHRPLQQAADGLRIHVRGEPEPAAVPEQVRDRLRAESAVEQLQLIRRDERGVRHPARAAHGE